MDLVPQDANDLIKSIASDSFELDSSVEQLDLILKKYLSLPIDDLQFHSIGVKVEDVLHRIDHEISQTNKANSMISKNDSNIVAKPLNPALLLPSKHRKMFDYFLNKELEIASMPYPPLCGAIPHDENKMLPIGSFVAATSPGGVEEYILCYVQGYSDSKYIIADVMEADQSVNFQIDRSKVIPMPTSLPDRKTKATEYPPGTKVLSLWPVESTWTSVFYVASVVKSPSETGRAYKLKFDGDNEKPTFVPEKYVILRP